MPQVHHAAAERQQRRVDVARLLDAVAGALRLRVALGTRQVAERQPAKTTCGPSADVSGEDVSGRTGRARAPPTTGLLRTERRHFRVRYSILALQVRFV